MKVLLGIALALVLIILLVLALPFLIDLNKYQDRYRPIIEDALDRKIQLQDIRLTIWPRFGARIAGFTVMDDPAFAAGPFASLTSLDVGVKLMPLFSGKVEVEEIELRDPVITVIKNKTGVMNVATIGPKGAPKPEVPKPEAPAQPSASPLQALALLAVDRVAITGGKLTYRDLSTPTPTEYMINDLEFLLQSVHMGETPSLHLVAMLQPFNLPLRLDGNFGPLVQTLDIKQFNFDLGAGKVAVNLKGSAVGGNLDATLSSPLINTSDLPVAVPLEKPVQVKNLHITAKAQYPLKQGAPPLELADVTHLGLAVVMGNSTINITGSVLGGHAKVSVSSAAVNTADLPVAVPLKKPVEIKELQVTMDLKDHDARVPNLSFQLFNGQAKAQAGMTMGANAPPFNGKVMIHGLQLGPALEAVGTDKVSVSGTADADLVLQGKGFTMPDLTNALEGTGHVAIREGKLEGLNLTQEILTALKAVGVSTDSAKATAFSAIEADLAIKQGIIHVQRLLMDSHDFQASGGGTVGFDQTLNLKLNLNLSQGLSQKLAGAIPGAKLVMAGGRLAVPLTVTGTAQAPSYGVDTKALGGRVQEQVKEKVKEAVGGLLKGSSKPEDLKKQGQELLKGLFGR